MKKILDMVLLMELLFLLILFLPISVSAQLISKVFPNPEGDDNNKEFVEIFLQESMNLTNYIIGDEASNDSIILIHYTDSLYALVVEEDFNWSTINVSIYSAGASIGNGLGNTKDTVFFYHPNGTLLDNFSYTKTEEGKILVKNETKQENKLKISFIGNTTLYINQTYTKLFRVDNEDNEDNDKKITAYVNITIIDNATLLIEQQQILDNISRYRTKDTSNILFDTAGIYEICGNVIGIEEKETMLEDNSVCTNLTILDPTTIRCDRNITIHLNNSVYPNKKQIPIEFEVAGTVPEEIPFEITYQIQEFSGIQEKQETKTKNTKKKHWTPEITKDYALFLLSAELTQTGCDDINNKNNKAVTQILIKNKMEEEGKQIIEHVYLGSDGVAKQGESISVKVSYYTGNLSSRAKEKQKIQAYIEDEEGKKVSETTQISLEESYQDTTITLPILLDYSCSSSSTEEKIYAVILEGFGTEKQKIPVKGVKTDLCMKAETTGEYTLVQFPEKAQTADSITLNITMHNTDTEQHTYTVSSKVYRGPKTYAGDFFVNQQKIVLDAGKTKNITLENNWSFLEPGVYSMKIQIQKDQQKKFKEWRGSLVIEENVVKQTKENTDVQILTMGTITTEPKEQALLFAEVQGNGEYLLQIDSLYEREEIPIIISEKQLVLFNATLAEGKNNIVLTLLQNNTQKVVAPLFLYATKQEVTNMVQTNKADQSKDDKSNKMTGMTLVPVQSYATSWTKITTLINSFLIILLLGFNILLVIQKHNIYKTTSASQQHAMDQSKGYY